MTANPDLRQAFADLDRIDKAGQLDELWHAIRADTHGRPANDLEGCTLGERIEANRLARPCR